MRLHRLVVQNFRGIKTLEWLPKENLTCLIGPGDSTKTTILDALSLILTTRPSIKLCDADFYEGNLEAPILIEAVLTDLPEDLISLDGLGSYICGVAEDGSVHTDPEEEDEKALTVRFTSDQSLEPIWEVVKPNAEEIPARHLTVTMRSKFGVFRVDENVDTHLRWGRGSALAAITAGLDGAASTTVQAQRAARQAVFNSEEETLTEAASKVKAASNTFGATKFKDLRVGLDPQSLNTGYGLVLHDGEVPLTGSGLGTRRLISLGIQEARTVGANIILIDEVETGLEPHRLVHLLRLLKKRAEQGAQVIMTTHSPLVVEFFGASGLAIVRRDTTGKVTIQEVPEQLASLDKNDMQRMIRSGPSAMLAKQIVIVEGATEMGAFRSIFDKWDQEQIDNSKEPLAVLGTAVRNGEGDEPSLERGACLAKLGFPTLVLIDSDKPLVSQEQAARDEGADVVRWGDGLHFEGRISKDLPENKLKEFIEAAIEAVSDPSAVLNAVAAKLQSNPTLTGTDPVQWAADHSISLDDIRTGIGAAAHTNKWFKKEISGIKLGDLLHDAWNDIENKPLGQRISEVRAFAYPEAEEEEESVA